MNFVNISSNSAQKIQVYLKDVFYNFFVYLT